MAAVLLAMLPSLRSAADEGPLAARLLVDARNGRLDEHDLVSACLIAGGATGADLPALHDTVEAAIERTLATLSLDGEQDRAARLHEALHNHLLTGRYDRNASDLARTVNTGDYNCLTATALYCELCRRAGVPCEVVAQPGHVYCLVGTPGLRVEPGSAAMNGALHTPFRGAQGDENAGRISPIQLAARFAYNRGVSSLARRQFEPGIVALRLACQLDPDDADGKANLLAGLNNWAVSLADEQPAAASALIARGLAIDPHYAPLVANQRYFAERMGRAQP